MTWNYRIVFHLDHKTPWYGLHEVFYNEAGEPEGWTGPIEFVCDEHEGPEGIRLSLRDALEDAVNRPVLATLDGKSLLEEGDQPETPNARTREAMDEARAMTQDRFETPEALFEALDKGC